MTKLLASTALIAILAMPALSQTAEDPAAPATDAPATTEAPALDGTTAPADGSTAPADGMAPAPADGGTTTADAPAGNAPATGFGYPAAMGDISANTFIGKRLYVSEADVDATVDMTEAGEGWEDIGEISDLVIGQDGGVKAVLVDIGGFLGMGERTVAVSKDQIDVIRDGNSEDDYFLVFTADRAALEGATEYTWPADQ